uniref:Serpin domain-containing protein n=1 Tax=Glossina brevipalpis TaxID=37001 RepID=A0A1A9WHJ0_9MUSC
MNKLKLYSFVIILLTLSVASTKCQSVDGLIKDTFAGFQQETTAFTRPEQQSSTSNNNNLLRTSTNRFERPKQFDQRICDVIAKNVLNFARLLGAQLNSLERSEIFSPLSIMSALSLLTLGAKGRSYQELKQMIGLDNDSELMSNPQKFYTEFALMLEEIQHMQENDSKERTRKKTNWRTTNFKNSPTRQTTNSRNQPAAEHVIRIANGIFIQNDYALNPNYKQIVTSLYDSELTQLDYERYPRESRDYINAWVNTNTRGKISKIISGNIPANTNILLASVLYFKGFWETSFFPRATNEQNFYQDGAYSPPLKVQLMATGGVFPFYDAKEYDCRVIGLPYKGNETTMYVIQPNNSTRQKLRDLQYSLDAEKIDNMIEKMVGKTTVMVFPKMHFTQDFNMRSLLQRLGVRDIFNSATSDLSLIGDVSQYTSKGAPVTKLHSVQMRRPIGSSSLEQEYLDRYNEPALVFSSRIGELNEDSTNSEMNLNETSILIRRRRQANYLQQDFNAEALTHLEEERLSTQGYRSDLFVDEIIHKVDFTVDEQGTEAAAATLTYLRRSGTDVVFRGDTPFLVLIRHDPTKLPLFYGIINKPEL